MIPGFEKIVEERIRTAQKKGDFDDLPYAGKPLSLESDLHIAEDLRLSYKILKNAGCVPPEIDLKKQIVHLESLLADMDETPEAYRLLKKLNFLIMKLNCVRDGNVSLDSPQIYREKLLHRFATPQASDSQQPLRR